MCTVKRINTIVLKKTVKKIIVTITKAVSVFLKKTVHDSCPETSFHVIKENESFCAATKTFHTDKYIKLILINLLSICNLPIFCYQSISELVIQSFLKRFMIHCFFIKWWFTNQPGVQYTKK